MITGDNPAIKMCVNLPRILIPGLYSADPKTWIFPSRVYFSKTKGSAVKKVSETLV
jgi:hypothetical protein